MHFHNKRLVESLVIICCFKTITLSPLIISSYILGLPTPTPLMHFHNKRLVESLVIICCFKTITLSPLIISSYILGLPTPTPLIVMVNLSLNQEENCLKLLYFTKITSPRRKTPNSQQH